MKKAIITGIGGQDGSYLAELLLEKGYEVHGVELPVPQDIRCNLVKNIEHLGDKVTTHFISLLDRQVVWSLVEKIDPDECYHLAASSFVSYDPNDEFETLQNNILGTHNILSAISGLSSGCRIFFAGSSELFGQAGSAPQDENTPFNPRSVYGITKLTGYNLVKYYREHHRIFACSGIFFNHESPRRGLQYVTRKITSTAAKIKLGLEEKLFLGNLDALRDWGYAPDYVQAIWLMLQKDEPVDYVLSTGQTHSVRDFVKIAFQHLDLDYQNYVEIEPIFFRSLEEVPLVGRPDKAQRELGWVPSKSFEEVVVEMVEHDLALLSSPLKKYI
jgi:GDPmannose 4,6-dehydratase